MNYAIKRQEYLTEFLTRNEYRKFQDYIMDNNLTIGHTVEKLDKIFRIVLEENSLANWEEILKDIRVD